MANSEDIARYIRCNKLIGQVLTPILREYMQLTSVPPATVYHTITQPYCAKFRTKLSQKEMRIVQTLLSDNYEKFDITLMYKIARDKNFKMIIKDHPTRKWGAIPLYNEIRIGDDIERMRLSRDDIMHNPHHLVSETEFNIFFDKFVEVATRADVHVNKTALQSYTQQIHDLRSSPIDPETTKKLYKTMEENKNLKEIVQLQRFPVFMEKDVTEYINEVRNGNEKPEGKKRIKMVLNGLENPGSLAKIINSHREEINIACKGCFIKLNEASEGSLVLHLEVHERLFQSDSFLLAEMDRFLEILFTVISLKPEVTDSSYIMILNDDSCMSDSSSEEEDNFSVEIADKKLVLDLTVDNKALKTDECIRQNLNSFVEAVVGDMDGQHIQSNDDVTAFMRLNKSSEEDTPSCDKNDSTHEFNLTVQNVELQTNQQQHRYVEVEITDICNQQVKQDDDVTAGVISNKSAMSEFDRQHCVSIKFKHIKVQVITGLFYNEQTDVVVNSTSQKLNLNDGLGSKALFKAAGVQIQSEISAKYPDGVVCGELAISGGHNLYCALVFHCFLKRWTEGDKDNAEKVLKQIVTSSLQEAHEKHDVQSITFPALGRGFSNFKADNVAKLMFQCVADFEESLDTEPTVKDVRFVIYPGDEEGVKAFIEEAKQRSQNVVTTMEYSTDIGNVRFTLVRGSLTKQVCDVVVNETLENLDMSKLPMSKELCAAAGPGLHLSLKQNVGKKIGYGHIAVTGNADLTNCKAVYHGALPLYKESSKVECRQAINIFLMQCFMEATESGYHSISLPPLGTDLKGYSAELSAEAIQGSIIEYLSGNCDDTSLQNIYLVVHPSAGNIFRAFKDKMFRYAKGKEKLDKTLIAKPPKQGEPCAPVSVENMPLNLVQMPRMPARGTIQWFIQMYQNDLMTPPYWTYFPGGERLRKLKVDPTFASKGAFKLVDVDQKTLQAIRSLVQKTWNEDSFKHGRDAAGLVDLKYNKIKVMGVKRLENLNLFEKYASFRQQMFGKVVTKSSIFRSPEQIRQSKGQLLTTHHIDPCLTKDIYREINEHYVFHGTKAENIEIILATGLDSRMAGANAMFGQGVYGAESSTKSDQYADDRANRDMSPKSMFLTRMCMGEICVVDKPLRMQRPPCRSCLSLRCKKECRNTKLFDSVLVDGQWIFREMVVYDHAQCYPEFLIKYQRVK